MSISPALHSAILQALGISSRTLHRRVKYAVQQYGPMSGDEARWVIAHQAGIDLRKYGLSQAQLDRVRELRLATEKAQSPARGPVGSPVKAAAIPATRKDTAPTPRAIFTARSFHQAVVKSSRKLFVDGHSSMAIYKAFLRLNNRVKKLTGMAYDGYDLMNKAFSEKKPALQMTGLSNQSEINEHNGTRFLMAGAMLGLRNPRAHEDHWKPDDDLESVLDALSFASLLHRFLDRCEIFREANP